MATTEGMSKEVFAKQLARYAVVRPSTFVAEPDQIVAVSNDEPFLIPEDRAGPIGSFKDEFGYLMGSLPQQKKTQVLNHCPKAMNSTVASLSLHQLEVIAEILEKERTRNFAK
eukprot:c6856_g1_i1.p1 GENE.c6856_g1_i1~~c6856_g1_i1.p1  ORF type:complete len:122 (-),score=25.22 c6856_g1_i1:362-700(-)